MTLAATIIPKHKYKHAVMVPTLQCELESIG